MEEEDIDVIAKQLWRFSASSFREALEEKPELAPFADRLGTEKQLDLLVDLTERLDRLPRHISMHPCGVILSDAHLLERTPVEPSGIGLPMSQFDKHDMDPMGMLKLDVLGVRMQSAITYALEEIQRLHPDAQAVAKAGDTREPSPGKSPTTSCPTAPSTSPWSHWTTNPPSNSSAPPTPWAASRSNHPDSANSSASSRPGNSTTSSSTSPSSAPDP